MIDVWDVEDEAVGTADEPTQDHLFSPGLNPDDKKVCCVDHSG